MLEKRFKIEFCFFFFSFSTVKAKGEVEKNNQISHGNWLLS